jgi:two-component system, OmpR family, sensor histidine kinase VicK
MASSAGLLATEARRPFGVRLYLMLAFVGVALISAGLAYLLVSETAGKRAANERLEDLAVGRTTRLASEVGNRPARRADDALDGFAEAGYSAWLFDAQGRLTRARMPRGVSLGSVEARRDAVRAALVGSRYIQPLPGDVFVVSTPVFREGTIAGAVLARSERPPELQEAIEAVDAGRLTALGIALVVAIAISFLVAHAITSRVKRLATSAAVLSEGHLDQPLEGTGGRDEITDLGRALERMRAALRGTFGALRSERDRLSAILEALDEAVIVVGDDGVVRFSNQAARPLMDVDGKAIGALRPWLRRAARDGFAEQDGLQVGEHVYAIGARRLAAEGAVLAVIRDRTEELRRELAEREFVSNAAHELRNPIAGISSAVEVLRSGAKDDPEARDHFLARLSDDAERVSRLTESLLLLARMEAVSEVGGQALDVQLAIEDAAAAVSPPDGIEVTFDVEPDLSAEGDPVLLRQVLVGLLTNAFKHTPPPGTVTLAARRRGQDGVLIEVHDTGTGIPDGEVDRIFERFYRGSGSLEREGFGLGLAIAKRMVDVMGGEIGVESAPGRGSTFWVRLPAAQPAPTPVA